MGKIWKISLYDFASRLELPGFGFALAALLIIITLLAYLRISTALDVSGLGIVVTLLASPLAWVGYAVLLLPIFFSRRWSLFLVVSAILLSVPSIIVYYIGGQSDIAQIGAGMIYFIALVLVLWELIHIIKSTTNTTQVQDTVHPSIG